jgi:hypothetical protein
VEREEDNGGGGRMMRCGSRGIIDRWLLSMVVVVPMSLGFRVVWRFATIGHREVRGNVRVQRWEATEASSKPWAGPEGVGSRRMRIRR